MSGFRGDWYRVFLRVARERLPLILLPALLIAWSNPTESRLPPGVLCEEETSPLLSRSWQEINLSTESLKLGEWRLPISAERPEVVTQARIGVDLNWNSERLNWEILLSFSFPDPKPYGIPFSFQKIQIEWDALNGPQQIEMDWSGSCQGPGRSLYPRQSWEHTEPTELVSENQRLRNVRVKLWGIRN